jgi:hypothetical protein
VVNNHFEMLARFRLDEYTVFLQKVTGRWEEELGLTPDGGGDAS